MPDGDAALEGLTAFLARFSKILNPLFDGIRKARDMEKCLYEGGRSSGPSSSGTWRGSGHATRWTRTATTRTTPTRS